MINRVCFVKQQQVGELIKITILEVVEIVEALTSDNFGAKYCF